MRLSSNQRYLIINADDFGMCHAANAATMAMFNDGVITSTSIMPTCPWYPEARDYAVSQRPDIGLHLTLTSEWNSYRWGGLTRGVSLYDTDGYFPNLSAGVEKQASKSDVLQEIHAQIRKVQNDGIQLTNIDSHMGSVYGLFYGDQSFNIDMLTICKELNLPYRLPRKLSAVREKAFREMSEEAYQGFLYVIDQAAQMGVELIDYLLEYPFHMEEGETYSAFKETVKSTLRDMEPGVNELFLHPAMDSEEIRHINPHWQKRVWEYKVFYEDEIQNVIREEGIQLINWNDLKNSSV